MHIQRLVPDRSSIYIWEAIEKGNTWREKEEKKREEGATGMLASREATSELESCVVITSHRFINSVTLETRFVSPRLGLADMDNRYHDARTQYIYIYIKYPYRLRIFEPKLRIDLLPARHFFPSQLFPSRSSISFLFL